MKAASADKSRTWAIHPFLFAILPVINFYYQNIRMAPLRLIVRPMLFNLLLTLVLFLLFRAAFRSSIKAGLFVSSLLIFIFYVAFFNAILYWLLKIPPMPFFIGWLVFFLAAFLIVSFARIDWRGFNSFLNAFTIISVIVISSAIGFFEWKLQHIDIPRFPGDLRSLAPRRQPPAGRGNLPDIYYIILDAYGRDDVLRDVYRLDNHDFLASLEKKGFFVAGDSCANYNQTLLSLASSLNMRYLHPLDRTMGADSMNRRPLERMIDDSDLVHFLKKMGYTIISFNSMYSGAAIHNADILKKPSLNLNDFETALVNTTILGLQFNAIHFRAHIQHVLYPLDEMGNLSPSVTPKFVFAHVICPHPPFVFARDGRSRIPDDPFGFNDGDHYIRSRSTYLAYLNGYREQVLFINRKLQGLVASILKNSRSAPVIILQGDHGPGSRLRQESMERSDVRERMAILNAIYLPPAVHPMLYDKISPVNTFRVVLNEYFDTSLPLLDDQAYFVKAHQPYSPAQVGEEQIHRREP